MRQENKLAMIQRGFTNKDSQRSLTIECKSLRDLVHKLRQEILMCNSETQKVKDQLQCLIYLVRRAWSGDTIAAIHVANIVGVAAPKFEKNMEDKKFAVSPKSSAVNNWARLCIGMLNRMYHEEELELRAAQLMYLQDREGYLDDELADYSDVMRHQNNMALLRTNTYQLLQEREEEERKEKRERIEQLEKQRVELQKQYHRQHPPHSHLYRKPSRDTVKPEVELNPDDLMFVKPVSHSRPSSGVHVQKKNLDLQMKESTDVLHDLEEEVRHGGDVAVRQRVQNKLHYRSRNADDVTTNRPRPKTATTGKVSRPLSSAKPRPVSAYLTKPRADKPPASGLFKTRRQIDLIDRDLKLTTKTLQDRLGICKQGMV